MRKTVVNLAVSLDGYIEGPNGEYDWCFADQDYGLIDFAESTDAIFMGRKSYDVITASGDIAQLLTKKIYVFSDTVTDPAFGDIGMIASANFAEAVKEIKDREGMSIWVFGGAGLIASLLEANLIDELLLSVHPILLGGGTHLFGPLAERISLNLTETIPYSSGLVQLRYQILPKINLDDIAGFDQW